MLDMMRKWQKGALTGILGVVIVTMLFYLVPQSDPIAGAAVSGTVIQVGDEKVEAEEFRQTFLATVPENIRSQFTPEQFKAFGFDRRVLNSLIPSRVVATEAKRLGFEATTAEVAQQIVDMPTFHDQNGFIGHDRYTATLQSFNLTVEQFEQQMRIQILGTKLRDFVTAGVIVTDKEIDDDYRNKNEKAKLDYLVIDPVKLEAKTGSLPDQAVRDYFEKNKAQYTVPEKRQGRYLFLSNFKLRNQVNASDAELKAYFDQHTQDYQIPTMITAQHILFDTKGKNAGDSKKVEEKARGVLERAKKGENFAALAKQFSEDSKTAKDGGNVGTFGRGQMVKPFEDKAFSMEPGAISDLVQTSYGFHIIKVNSRQEGRPQTFEEMKPAITNIVLEAKASEFARDVAQKTVVAVVASKDLGAEAQKVGGEVKETPLFENDPTKALPGLGVNADFVTRAFALEKEGDIASVPLKVDGGYAIMMLGKIAKAHPAELEEVRADVTQKARRAKGEELALERANQAQEMVKAGKSLQAIAGAVGAEVKTSDLIARGGNVTDFGSISDRDSEIFTGPIGKVGTPASIAGKTMVFAVKERQAIKPEEMQKARDSVRTQLISAKQDRYFAAYIAEVQKRMEEAKQIVVNQGMVDRLMR